MTNKITKTYSFNSSLINRKSGKVIKELFKEQEKTFTISVREDEKDWKFFGFFEIECESKGKKFSLHLDEKTNLLYVVIEVDINQYLYFVNEDDKKDFIETLDTIKKEYYEAKAKLERDTKEAQDYLKNNLKEKYEKIYFNRIGKFCKFEISDYAEAILEAVRSGVDCDGITELTKRGIEFEYIPYEDGAYLKNITKEQLLMIVKFGEDRKKAREEKRKAKADAKEKRIADAIQKAKETGEPQIIASWSEDCNCKDLDCDLDNIIEYIDGNGKRWTERNHTY